MTERYVSTSEAAKAVGVARTTLARWVREGAISPAQVTVGGHHRWDLDDLRRQLVKIRESEENS